jgi:Flp pilus assembly protein TadG
MAKHEVFSMKEERNLTLKIYYKLFKRIWNKIAGILQQQRGTTMIMTAALMVAILGCTAIVTDMGLTYIRKQKLSNALDAAALAAAQDISISEQKARETAIEYIQKNGFSEANVEIIVSSSVKSIEIKGKDNVDFYFARVLGFYNTQVDARAKAVVFPVTGMTGVRPLAVEDFPFQYGVQYVLKEGAGDGYNGNFGPVALGGTGANNYRNNIKYGYNGKLKVGDWIETETGNMPNPTEEGVDYLMNQCNHTPKCTTNHYDLSCPRIISIPIVDTLQVNGRNEVQIVGFAAFLLEGTTRKDGHLQVLGRFIKNITVGDSDGTGRDYGLYAVKLVE